MIRVFDYQAHKIPLYIKLLLLFQKEKGYSENTKDNEDYQCVVFYKKFKGVIYITRTHHIIRR